MVPEGDHVIIFHSIHRVMQAEYRLKEKGLAVRLIPAPRRITADCGLAITFPPGLATDVRKALAAGGILPADWYVRQGDDYRPLSPEERP
ncbi:MAG: DUF3343 domain-containing protein [Desulfuromonadia bacterium]